jgi:cyclophilin family peptidyl-prolyl cis-trans isomerase
MRRVSLLAAVLGLLIGTSCFAQQSNPEVVVDSSLGIIRLQLFPDKAPLTVKNFLSYVDDRFYDGTTFHRVIPNFMIQGGGLDKDLKEKSTRAPIRNESSNDLSNVRGSLAMARTVKPDSATVQFFINVKDNAFLDRAKSRDNVGYAVFGRVVGGMDVVDKICRVKTGAREAHFDVPVQPVVIRSIRRATEFSIILGGSFEPGKVFSITAVVDYPGRGQSLVLELPPEAKRLEGKEMQPVPSYSDGPAVVLWKARVLKPGVFAVTVRSTTGIWQTQKIKSCGAKD